MQPALQTSANSGLPVGLRKKTVDDDRDDDEGHAEWVNATLQERHDRLIARYGDGIIEALKSLGHETSNPDWIPPAELISEGGGEEGGGASDSAIVLALDRDSVRDKDREGRLRIAITNISKATVNPYKGSEIPGFEELGLEPDKIYQMLRDPAELEKAAATSNGVQLLRKHIPVNAEDHQPWDVVGALGTDASFENPYLRNSLTVWAKGDIDDIESNEKKELSMGYHYTPDMTPGFFSGMRYDGVMRDIVVNHVALVKDGRAGPDVVVGDSTENLMSKPTRLAALTLGLVAANVAPLLAKDSKIELPKALFTDITTKNIVSKKPAILAGIKQAMDGKLRKGLAMDASMESVGKVLDAVSGLYDKGEKGADESVSEEQHGAMEAAAKGESDLGIPKAVGKEFSDADAGKAFDAEPLKSFLKEKGVSDEDIAAACDMLPKTAMDAEETAEEKTAREKKEKDDKTAADKRALDEKTAKDNQMKDMVTKPAMDAALKVATEATAKSVRETERGIRVALAEVRPYVGELPATLAFDSGADVKRHALKMLGVDSADKLHADALDAVLGVQTKIGARPSHNANTEIAMDEETVTSFAKRFPGSERISAV